jgi:hypothetical protein
MSWIIVFVGKPGFAYRDKVTCMTSLCTSISLSVSKSSAPHSLFLLRSQRRATMSHRSVTRLAGTKPLNMLRLKHSNSSNNNQQGSPIVLKPDGTQDGPATTALHYELNPAHARQLESNSPDATTVKPPPDSSESSESTDSPVVTKPDGTLDGPATAAKHQKRAEERA